MTDFLHRVRAAAESLWARPMPPAEPDPDAGLPEMLGRLGTALLASSRATSSVERVLQSVAIAYDHPWLRSVVLPTVVIVDDSTAAGRTAVFPAFQGTLRLDQVGELEDLVRRIQDDRTPPAEVVRQVLRIRATEPRFGPIARILGYVLLTLGFGLVLDPALDALPVYAGLGVLVGTLVVVASGIRTLALILPVFSAFVVTLVAGLIAVPLIGDDTVRLVAPALISFLPGLTLTIAAVELTANQVIAGASRLVYGAAQLGLLAFGVYAAITVMGTAPESTSSPQLGWWAPWVGIAFAAVGYTLYSVAPPRAFGWILGTLAVAYGAQLGGAALVGAQLSGFVGAVMVILVVSAVARFGWGPPSAVMLTCAYWILVPGAIGFIGLSEATTGDAGTALLAQTAVSLLAIAIGMIVGSALTRDVSAISRAWRTSRAGGLDGRAGG